MLLIIIAAIVLLLFFPLLSLSLPILSVALFLYAILYTAFKIHEYIYFKSKKFRNIKQEIETYINECNELNRHIEELKHSDLIFEKSDFQS